MDPYYLLRQDLEHVLANVRVGLKNREDMLNDKRGIGMDSFTTIGIQMTSDISSINISLDSIQDSNQQIRRNRDQFTLTDFDLSQRDKFVEQTRQEIASIEERMKQQNLDNRLSYSSSSFSPNQPFSGAQSLTIDARAERLDNIYETVKQERLLTTMINEELDESARVINEIDAKMDTAQDKMKMVTNEIKTLIENEGKVPTLVVFVLSIVLVFLLFFVA